MKLFDSLKKKLSFLKWIDPFTYLEIVLRKYHPKKLNPSFQDEAIDSIVYVFSALIFAFLLFSILGFLLNTSYPMVIVSSSSMVPEMYRGDIIVLYGEKDIKAKEITVDESIGGKMFFEYGRTFPDSVEKITNASGTFLKINTAEEIQIGSQTIPVKTNGDIIVYFSDYSGKDIIHRAVAKINARDGTYFLTKGDANPSIDQECFPFKNNFGETVYVACITKQAVNSEQIKGKTIFRIPLLGCAKLWVFDNIPAFLSGRENPDFMGIC